MAKNDILTKLSIVLSGDISSECQVVYILSRIRKLLEISSLEKSNKNYKYLKFYCDWALHAEIGNTTCVEEFLRGMGPNSDRRFETFIPLKGDLKEFLTHNSLPNELVTNEEKWYRFSQLLSMVYLDTPLYVRNKEYREIKISVAKEANGGFLTMWDVSLSKRNR